MGKVSWMLHKGICPSFSEKGTFFDLAWTSAVDANRMNLASGHILRGQAKLSKYAADGYWRHPTKSESGMPNVMRDSVQPQ